jgi:integrase
LTNEKITLSELVFEHWLPSLNRDIRVGRLKEATVVKNEWYYRKHIAPTLGHLLVGEIDSDEIRKLHRAKRDSGLHWRSVKRIHEIVRMVMRFAVDRGYTLLVPADFSYPQPQRNAAVMSIWKPEQLRRFLNEVPEVRADPVYPAFVLICSTGMRRGEVLGLWWSDVDLDLGTVTIQRQVTMGQGRDPGVRITPTRSGRPRTIMLDPFSNGVLLAYKGRCETKWLFRNPNADKPYQSAKRTSEAWVPDSLTQRFHRLTRVAGLPPIRLHDLRHSYAIAALNSGVPPRIMAARLGHASVSTTMDLYSTPESMDQVAVVRVASLIFGAPGPSGA